MGNQTSQPSPISSQTGQRRSAPIDIPSSRRGRYRRRECYPRTVWCGKGPVPTQPKSNKVYTRRGTPYECLRIGFGGGNYSEKALHLPQGSLQTIKYIGEVYEERFGDEGIDTLARLVTVMSAMDGYNKEQLLTRVLTREGGGLDTRSFNSVLLFLDDQGVRALPKCHN